MHLVTNFFVNLPMYIIINQIYFNENTALLYTPAFGDCEVCPQRYANEADCEANIASVSPDVAILKAARQHLEGCDDVQKVWS